MNFSVIIPLYNKADTIERAIRSVLRQTCQDFEIVVVDDGSEDNGAEIVVQIHDPRICLIRQANGGVSAARNTGIANAKYDFVTFLDADDEYLPDYLETLSCLIQHYPDTAIWGTCYEFQMPDGRKVNPKINGIPADFEGYLPNYFEIASKSAPPLWTGAVCIRKKVLQDIGGFPVGIRSGEDLLTWARLCSQYTLVYNMRICSCFFQTYAHRLQIGHTRRMYVANDYVGNELIKLLFEVPIELRKDLRKYISAWYKMQAHVAFRNERTFCTIKYTIKSLRYDLCNYRVIYYGISSLLPNFINTKVIQVLRVFKHY